MSETRVAHTKPLSRMQSLSESRRGSKVTKPIFNNSARAIERFTGSNIRVHETGYLSPLIASRIA